MAMVNEAIKYAKRGIAVFPVEARGKKPLTDHGFKDASKDPEQIRKWWTQFPEANIGIATGKASGGIYVIDLDVDDDRGIDGIHTLVDWEREHGEKFPDTWTAITGRGGYHYYFKSDVDIKNRTGLLDGVDIRGNGGYVVAPPSVHKNGNAYEWEFDPDDLPIANADDMLIKLLETTTVLKRPDETFQLPEKIPKGQRNDVLFKAACSYQSKGLPDSAIMGAVKSVNQDNCESPLPEEEVERIVASALRYDKGQSDDDQEQGEDPVMDRNQNGSVMQSRPNVVRALEGDKGLSGKIRYNEIAYAPYIYGRMPWGDQVEGREWSNFDDSNLCTYLEGKYGLSNKDKIADGLDVVMQRYKFNPVIDMLKNIHDNKWDGNGGHIENLLSDYMGVTKDVYSTECMKILMLGAINRVYYPGCKFDYMPVLIGPQGIGKSTFFRFLAMDQRWYNDNFNTIEGDKASEKLRGMWIVEMAELLATKKAKEIESIKSFLTSTTDTYRPPYGRRTEQRKRMCVFVGTTNSQYFLTDQTGNRRFLPLVAHEENIKKSLFENTDEVKKDFENAWGEAMDIFLNDPKVGQTLTLSREASRVAVKAQSEFTEEDARVGIIQEWLDRTTVDKVCAGMIYKEAFGYEYIPDRRETTAILSIMATMPGWEKIGKSYCAGYGMVICYQRKRRSHGKHDKVHDTPKMSAEGDGNPTDSDDDFMEIDADFDLPFD